MSDVPLSLGQRIGTLARRRKGAVTFVICTERHFEQKSLLLARSLRRYGGSLGANAQIMSYSPRPAARPSDEALHALTALDVTSVLDVENAGWPDYPFANKAVACADAERTAAANIIVFLDSDQVVLREPAALRLAPGIDAAARPVDRKYIGCGGAADDSYAYWMKLYEIAGASPQRVVETSLGRELIWEYYNSGLVAVRRNAGIFRHFERVLAGILASGVRPPAGITLVEQSSLAAAITAKAARVSILPREYNFPVTGEWRDTLRAYPETARQATSLHYHDLFDGGRWRELLAADNGLPLPLEKRNWLTANLAELGI